MPISSPLQPTSPVYILVCRLSTTEAKPTLNNMLLLPTSPNHGLLDPENGALRDWNVIRPTHPRGHTIAYPDFLQTSGNAIGVLGCTCDEELAKEMLTKHAVHVHDEGYFRSCGGEAAKVEAVQRGERAAVFKVDMVGGGVKWAFLDVVESEVGYLRYVRED